MTMTLKGVLRRRSQNIKDRILLQDSFGLKAVVEVMEDGSTVVTLWDTHERLIWNRDFNTQRGAEQSVKLTSKGWHEVNTFHKRLTSSH